MINKGVETGVVLETRSGKMKNTEKLKTKKKRQKKNKKFRRKRNRQIEKMGSGDSIESFITIRSLDFKNSCLRV